MTFADIVNTAEIPWWIGCGVFVFAKSIHTRKPRQARGYLAAFTLVAFGLSDAVELQTGAWWRPWWLLLWKAACITILVACAILYRQQSQGE